MTTTFFPSDTGKLMGEGSFGKVVWHPADRVVIKVVTQRNLHIRGALLHEYRMLRLAAKGVDLSSKYICALQGLYLYHNEKIALALLPYPTSLARAYHDGRNHFNITMIQHITAQCAKALIYLKQCNIIHTDIKPDNILVTSDVTIALTDFGSARLAYRAHRPHYEEQTLEYRSPEATLAKSSSEAVLPLSHEMDAWSLGVTLFEIYTKTILFPLQHERSLHNLIGQHEAVLRETYPQELIDTSGSHGKAIYQERITAPPINETFQYRLERTMSTYREKEFDRRKYIDFFSLLIVYLPYRRLTPEQMLRHPFLQPKPSFATWKESIQDEPPGISPRSYYDNEVPFPCALRPTREELYFAESIIEQTHITRHLQDHMTQKRMDTMIAHVTHTPQGHAFLKHESMILHYLSKHSQSSLCVMKDHKLHYLYHASYPKLSTTALLYDPGFTSSLQDYLGSNDDFPIAQIFSKAIRALVFLKEQGLLHNRISPRAFFIDMHFHVKLGDFTQACFVSQSHPLARDSSYQQDHFDVLHEYASPELLDNGLLSYASDIYSFGLVFAKFDIEVLSSQHPQPENRIAIEDLFSHPLYHPEEEHQEMP